MLNYKLNKQSIEFLFDNGFLTSKFTKYCEELHSNLNDIEVFLLNSLIEVKNSKGEFFSTYDSFYCAIVEYHLKNVFIVE